jgi:hypothetical protein
MTNKNWLKKIDQEYQEFEETKVMRLKPSRDENGMYVPYCNFRAHKGICLSEDICLERECRHLIKLYLHKSL